MKKKKKKMKKKEKEKEKEKEKRKKKKNKKQRKNENKKKRKTRKIIKVIVGGRIAFVIDSVLKDNFRDSVSTGQGRIHGNPMADG